MFVIYSGGKEETRRPVRVRQGRARHSNCWEGRHGKAGALIRAMAKEDFFDDEGALLYRWKPRGKLLEDALCVGDPDWFDTRAKHSTGWKERKYKRQWEPKARREEKRRKKMNRA